MKTRQFAVGLVLSSAIVMARQDGAHAWPSGPSAIEAARLMISPPNDWVAHYLPDDRYKVVGGIWKVVTTDLDTYYHRPNCPNMMRQSADRVIGFPSAKDAEDAGYRADPMCKYSAPGFGPGGGAFKPLAAGQVLLSDGRSRVSVPAGWKHVAGTTMDIRGMQIFRDTFFSPTSQRVEIVALKMTPEVSSQLGSMFTLAGWRKMQADYKKSRDLLKDHVVVGNSNFGEFMKMADQAVKVEPKAWKANGISGLHFALVPGQSSMNAMANFVGKTGDRLYQIVDFTTGRSNSSALINSLSPR